MKKFRRILSIILILSCLFTLGSVAAFAENEETTDSTSKDIIENIIVGEPISINSDIENAYIKYSRFCELHNEDNVLSFEDFLLAFNESEFSDVGLFLQSLMEDISPNSFEFSSEPNASTYSIGDDWYFNTGTSLPQKAKYSSYNLLTTARKGDIIHEVKGDAAFVLHHASIVEGIFWSSTYNQFYIRVIEAGLPKVSRGVFDEERLANKEGTILRVSASEEQRNNAVVFCISQLGKAYALHTSKRSSASSDSWYCSELVWAAYKNQGIELLNSPAKETVLPDDLYSSNKTSIVGYSSIKPASRFTDTSGNWAKASIDYLVNNAMMKGLNSTTFAPNTIVDRVTLVTTLHNLAGRPSVSTNPSFPDIGSLPGAERLAVKWAAAIGITGGYEDGTFKPYQQLTRQQFMVFLYRFASYLGASTSYNSNAFSGFTDASSVSAYAVIPMKWALTKGIINGTTSTTLSPLDPCTRAQCATIVNRFINICM